MRFLHRTITSFRNLKDDVMVRRSAVGMHHLLLESYIVSDINEGNILGHNRFRAGRYVKHTARFRGDNYYQNSR